MKQFSEYTCAASARIYKTFREGAEARENCLVYITRASARVIYARKQLHVACIYYIDPRDIDFVQTHNVYLRVTWFLYTEVYIEYKSMPRGFIWGLSVNLGKTAVL